MRIKAIYDNKYSKRIETFYLGQEINCEVEINDDSWLTIYYKSLRDKQTIVNYRYWSIFEEDWKGIRFVAIPNQESKYEFEVEHELRLFVYPNRINVIAETQKDLYNISYSSFGEFLKDWK